MGLAAKKRARECSRWALSSSWMSRAGGVAGWGGSFVAGELGRDRVKTVWSRRLLAGSPAAVAGLEDELGSWKEWETCQWKRELQVKRLGQKEQRILWYVQGLAMGSRGMGSSGVLVRKQRG